MITMSFLNLNIIMINITFRMLPLSNLNKYITQKQHINKQHINKHHINTLNIQDLSYAKSKYRYYDYDTIYEFELNIDNEQCVIGMNANSYKVLIAVKSVFMEFRRTKQNKLKLIYARDQRNIKQWIYLYPNKQKISMCKIIPHKYDLRIIYINGCITTIVISPIITVGNHKQVSTITLKYNHNHQIYQIEIQYCGRFDNQLYVR